MKLQLLQVPFLLLFFFAPLFAGDLKTYNLKSKSGENFDVLMIEVDKNAPTIIYNHGLIVEKLGLEETAQKGYDVRDFIKAIAQSGYNALAPIREYKFNISASDYISATLDLINKQGITNKKIAMIGFSKGGVISVEAATSLNQFSAIVLISPALSEKISLTNYNYPTLITLGTEDPKNLITTVKKLFIPQLKPELVTLKEHYQGNHQSFWKVRPKHWQDIISFINKNL